MTYAATILADSPTAYWRMGESSGSIASEVGTYTLAADGTPTYSQTGAISGDADTAILFDGSTEDFFLVTASGLPSGAGTRTLEAWAKTTSTATDRTVVAYGVSASAYDLFDMIVTNGALRLRTRNSAGTGYLTNDFSSTGVLNDGAWHHIAISYTGTVARGYIDGVKVGSDYTVTCNTTSANIQIGVWSGWFAGTIDEVAIYPTELSEATLAAHVAAGTEGSDKVRTSGDSLSSLSEAPTKVAVHERHEARP